DDTRVTPMRLGLACAAALIWAAFGVLPAIAAARVSRDGLSEAQQAALSHVMLHADATTGYAADDKLFPFQWALDNNPSDADIDISQAWEHDAYGLGVDVAVVDQRIETTHEDLAANIAPGDWTDFVATDKKTAGCDAPTPTGINDHGTFVAGEIAALRN